MSIVKNDDFKIVKGENKLSFINFTLKQRNTIFAPCVEYTLIIIQELIQQ